VKEPFLRSRGSATLLFFFSGATGLIYEVLWTRQFELILGATTYSAGAVLAAFMGGLYLGSRWGGRWAGLFKNPLWVYGCLELGIGLYAFLLASSFHQVDLGFQFLETHWPFPHSLFIIPRFFGCGALLILPTTFMGATLPCLSGLAAGLETEGSSYAGRLYAVNTTGAVAGAVLAGYWLLPALGQWKTAVLAASANGLLGLAALGLGLLYAKGPSQSPAVKNDGMPLPLEAPLVAALAVAGLSGVAAIMDEVGYNRVLCMILGGSAYAFSAMLAAFLSGLSAGSFVFSRSRVSGPSAAGWLAAVQLGLGLVVLLTVYSFDHLWLLFMELAKATDHFHLDLDQWQKGIQFSVAFTALFPTAFLCGAVFPLVLKADPWFSSDPAAKVGRVYGANTLGAILGALLSSLVLIPWVGVQKTLEAGVCLNGLAAGLLLLSRWRVDMRKFYAAALGLMLVLPPLLWALLPSWNKHNLAVGPFFQAISASDYIPDYRDRLAQSQLLYYKEGLVNTVTVEKAPEFNTIVLSNNGKVEASSVGDLPTEQLVSHIPLLWRECTLRKSAQKVAVIGLASGITAGTVLTHNPESLDVVDLEPFMPQAAAFFKDFNFQILTDPRFHFIPDDARHYLRLVPQKYDVIICEPSNPWLSGVSNLFSRECFEIGKGALAPGGVYCQWVQIYGMKTGDVKAICRTFHSVFPYVYVFGVPPPPDSLQPVPDLVLLGSLEPLKPSVPYMEKAIKSGPLQKALDRIGMNGAGDLVSLLRMGPAEVEDFCAGAGLDTDDNGLIEYSAPLHLYDGECYVANMLEIRKFQPDPTGYVEPEKPETLKRTLLRVAEDLKDYWGNDFAAGLRHKAQKL
jgi:spermidine synthase